MRIIARLGLAFVAVVATTSLALAAQPESQIVVQGLDSPNVIQDRYIVVFKDGASVSAAQESAVATAVAQGGTIHFEYETALNGFAATLPAAALETLRQNPAVASIDTDKMAQAAATQSPATWGIDRVDQRALPLSNSYIYNYTGQGVHVYVIDSGIRQTHTEFEDRASRDLDVIKDGENGNDCYGHGTHVSGTIGGKTYGVAKKARIHSLRALNCMGNGPDSGVIEAIDWITKNHQKPAVVNMSLTGDTSTVYNAAIKTSTNAGVLYVVAAGNGGQDACNVSPASAPEVIAVGASNKSDGQAGVSNYGSCIDIYAPGDNVTSAYHTSDTATSNMTGTSMASPHVAGAAALYLETRTSSTPSQTRDAILNASTTGRLTGLGTGSPNKLLYTLIDGGTPVTPTKTPTTGPGTPTATPVTPTATPVTPTTTPSCSAPAWRRNVLYWANDKVSHNGREWRARTWSLNEEPGRSSSWTDLGTCR